MDKTVIVSDACPHCQRVQKNILERNLPIKILNYKSEEGKQMVKDLNITKVPECVIIEDGKVRKCSDGEFDEVW